MREGIEGLKRFCGLSLLRLLVGNREASIFTYTSAIERLVLYREACLSLQSGVFVEVGSYLGASAVVLAKATMRNDSKRGVVYCIDTWCNDAMVEGKRDTLKEFEANTIRFSDRIFRIVGRSDSVKLPQTEKCDLIFLDGDHSYESTRADAARYSGLVRSRGRLVMHDHRLPSVARVIGELLATGDWTIVRSVENIISLMRQ